MLKISLVIGDAAGIRNALHELQVKKYSKTKAIASHCPTRWAITLIIALDVLETKDALRELVESREWKDLAKSSSNSGMLRRTAPFPGLKFLALQFASARDNEANAHPRSLTSSFAQVLLTCARGWTGGAAWSLLHSSCSLSAMPFTPWRQMHPC